jgi:triacylglycerol esterase/lipase EstA (alpha/beta hydrolase family)
MKGFRSVPLLAAAWLSACATLPLTEFRAVDGATECVVLLHGVNRSYRAMRPMAEDLNASGYMTANVDYPTRLGTVEELVPMSVDNGVAECRRAGASRIHFVTHSIGGILLRYAHQQHPIEEMGRVVMLAPPNQGSEVVDKTRKIPGATLVGGEALMQLGTGPDDIPAQLGPVDFDLGVIAGTGTMNPWMSAMLPDPDDGKVSLPRTAVGGMDDFLIVDDNHHYIMEDEVVIRNTRSFLQTGSFILEDKARLHSSPD